MPDKKKKNVSSKARGGKRFRQTTLFDSIASSPSAPPPASSSLNVESHVQRITPARPKRKHVSESSESSDIGTIKLQPTTPSRKSKFLIHGKSPQSPLPSRLRRRRRVTIESESDENEERSSDDSDSSEVAVQPRRRLRRLASKDTNDLEEESLPRRRRTLSRGTSGDEVDEDRIIESRLRARKMTAFQKNLERLKRKKQGKPMSSSESAGETEEPEDDKFKPFQGARPATNGGHNLFSEDDSSDGSSSFIVEDDNQAIVAELPSEFSMRSHEDLSHQFKIIFQLFVHTAVRPAADRRAFMKEQTQRQEYFSFPLKVTRRKLSGIRDSLVASSVWRPKFKGVLEKYPTFELEPLDFAVPSCDACHLGGRLSTVTGRVGGIPYDKLGFMDQIMNDTDESSGNDSTNSSQSATRLKKSKFGFLEFHLGRFCARRVRIYHEFSHWEYQLFNIIRSEIDDLRAAKAERGFVRVAFAGGKQPPDDLTDADAICEWLDERGFIEQEWHRMKTMMENAHHLELSAKKGEGD